MPTLFLARETLILGNDRELRRQCQRGELHRIRPGVYYPARDWRDLEADDRYRMMVRAAAVSLAPGTQFSHDSAAALWRLPSLTHWPSVAHTLIGPRAGGISRAGLRCHSFDSDPASTKIDGVAVTSLPRTLLDVATQPAFARAVAMLDAGIRVPEEGDFLHTLGVVPPTREELLLLHEARLPHFASARARRALEFADGRSGSPRESLFRCQCYILGVPAPQLQVPFHDEDGFIGFADAYWEHLGLIVEIDGDIKYGARRKYQLNRTPEQILLAEKRREDRMRRVVKRFARPPQDVIRDRQRLRVFLAHHGLVPAPGASR
ncbi:hypothetical protein FVA74_01485 [Salinibacterium sp. dk2585]|uniref:hypothetical protein n=1 Tax=unclassified Salinibacterium TaxID=2632331 RepID=UPI0011C25821|nr:MULTISPECIES: hypothetical protein [unclassified Salinibacterium]QEE60384.1 hypothetical protein FVA74_01485 [Salinibacterium sp. dk2585]TXK55457.1 hypothetical protein FVP63_01630 [Salinibacterium sp. dk5596]